MHFITFKFKRQLNFTNIFNATVDFATAWPTSKLVVECLTLPISYHPRLSFDSVPSLWCQLELKKHSCRDMLWQAEAIFEKAVRTVVVWFTHSTPEPRQWHCMKKITCRWIIPSITILVLSFIGNISYKQRSRERISCKCSFLLVIREILLELNFKRLKAVYYRCLRTLIVFFSFFAPHLTTFQTLQHFLAIFSHTNFATSNKMLADCREAGCCFYPFLVA